MNESKRTHRFSVTLSFAPKRSSDRTFPTILYKRSFPFPFLFSLKGGISEMMVFRLTFKKNLAILRLMVNLLPYDKMKKNFYGEGSFIDQLLKFAKFCT